MLQWRPGSQSEVRWNDREGDRFVTRILDVETGEKRTVPMAVNHVSPDGRWAVTTDFSRVQDARAGYGYPGLADPFRDGGFVQHACPVEIDGAWDLDYAGNQAGVYRTAVAIRE